MHRGEDLGNLRVVLSVCERESRSPWAPAAPDPVGRVPECPLYSTVCILLFVAAYGNEVFVLYSTHHMFCFPGYRLVVG